MKRPPDSATGVHAVCTVVLPAIITESTVGSIRSALAAHATEPTLVWSFAQVQHIDAVGARLLMDRCTEIIAVGRQLTFTDVPPVVKAVLHILRLLRHAPIPNLMPQHQHKHGTPPYRAAGKCQICLAGLQERRRRTRALLSWGAEVQHTGSSI